MNEQWKVPVSIIVAILLSILLWAVAAREASAQDTEMVHYATPVECSETEDYCLQLHIMVSETSAARLIRWGTRTAPINSVVMAGTRIQTGAPMCFRIETVELEKPEPTGQVLATARRALGGIFCYEHDGKADTYRQLDVSDGLPGTVFGPRYERARYAAPVPAMQLPTRRA